MIQRSVVASILAIFLCGSFSQATTGKEFTTSVIYGALAGTLVGAATLAFTSNPGDNLNNVARGASWGLYLGILLGAYVTYGVNDEPPKEEVRPKEPGDEELPPGISPEGKPEARLRNLVNKNKIAFVPIIPTSSRDSQWGLGLSVSF